MRIGPWKRTSLPSRYKERKINMIRERVDVALCFNDAYLKHVGPLVYALSKNNSDLDFLIHVVYKNLSEQSLKTLSDIEVLFPNISFDFRFLESTIIDQVTVEHTHFPIETYFRLVLADVLYDVDRLLYLDIDLLISGSIRGLWELDLQGACIAAAPEKDIYVYYQWYLDQLGMTEKDTYFSAGVLLFDLKQMRKRKLPEILVQEAIEKGESLRFCDQDLLNLYFKDEVVYFDQRYNYSSWQMANESKSLEDLSIEHFNGLLKPWSPIMDHPQGGQRQFAAVYQKYRREFYKLFHKEEALVSIIVDARQANEHIYSCLSSLTKQTHQNLEILLVLDTKDTETLEKIENYRQYDERIQHLIKDQTYDSVLSPLHLEHLSGSYLTCVSGTDFLEDQYIETLVALQNRYQVDIAAVDYYSLNVEKGLFYFHNANSGAERLITAKEAIFSQTSRHLGTVFGKLFLRTFLNTIYLVTDEKNLELNQLRRLYKESGRGIAYSQSHSFCHRTHLGLSEILPETLAAYESKIRAVEKAIVDNLILGLDTHDLQLLLNLLLEGLKNQKELTTEPLSRDIQEQLDLLMITD